MQLLQEPTLIHEQESTLLDSFLIGTKQNEAGWAINKETGHQLIKDFVGKDFVIIPERIFAPLSQGRGGHVEGANYDDEMAQITTHSHGKIVKVKGPYPYNDESDDYFYRCNIKLSGSKAASALIENGSKTWVPFAVSPQIWPVTGNDDDITDWKPMGLFLVIKGAYGDKAVVEKMCTGSALACGKSLSAAILELSNKDSDAYVGEVISSLVTKIDDNNHNMSAQTQVPQVVSDKIVTEIPQVTAKVEQPKAEEPKVEETKGIHISPEEYEAYKKEREEHKQLVLENKTNKLNSIFSSVADENTKKTLFDKYLGKSDFNSIVEAFDDFNTHILPLKIEQALKDKDSDNSKKESKSASVLKPEPKVENKDESKSASVVPNNINEVLQFSKMFEGDII